MKPEMLFDLIWIILIQITRPLAAIVLTSCLKDTQAQVRAQFT